MSIVPSNSINHRWLAVWEDLRARLEESGIVARLLGSAAIAFLCRERGISATAEFTPRDIDLIVQRRGAKGLAESVISMGGKEIPEVSMCSGGTRECYVLRNERLDVFMDPFTMCRAITIGKRMYYHEQTLSPGDIFLTKMQEISIQEQGLQHIIWLLRAYPIGHPVGRYAEVLSQACGDDWGLFEIILANCRRLLYYTQTQSQSSDADKLAKQIEEMILTLSNCRKSLRWRARSIFGHAFPWYNCVEEFKYPSNSREFR